VPTHRIIPSLLMRRGRLVKGVRFADHRDAGAPATTARAHSAQGADEIALLDIDARREGRAPDFDVLAAVAREIQVPLTYGGGVDSADIAHRCFEGGADKVCLTSTALDRPALLGEIARRYGEQAVVVGIDVIGEAGRWRLYDHRTGRPLATPGLRDWARAAVDAGAGELRLVSVEREGSRAGFDVALWNEVRQLVAVPMILEGGAGTLQQVAEAMQAGVDSVGLGTMLVFSDNNLVKVRRYLGGAGIKVRP
jgi:cyclase